MMKIEEKGKEEEERDELRIAVFDGPVAFLSGTE